MIVTAEIGTSWRGDFVILDDMLKSLSDIGVDYVKFQSLNKSLLDRHKELSWYESASLNVNNIIKIDKLCSKYNQEWYSTITEKETLDMISSYCDVAKIRVADSNNTELIEECHEKFDTVIVSSLRPLDYCRSRIKNLYCIPRYPTNLGEINFDMMINFDGYSNHCPDALAIFESLKYSLGYLEFHVTPSKDIFNLDNPVSFTMQQTKIIMDMI